MLFLADKVPDGAPLADALSAMRAADLYLACACSRGDSAAIAAFETRYFGEIDGVLARIRSPRVLGDDVRQMLRERLFVGTAKVAPKIVEYAGSGALASWFRVTAMRTVLNLVRGPKEVPLDAEMLLASPGGQPDPELEILKRRYRKDFRAAFAEAVGGLDPRSRNLLRYAYSEGLGSDELATIYGVHRTTVNRWLADLRGALLSGIRAAMVRDLGVGKKELESILRLIQSQLEVTLDGTPSAFRSGTG